MEEKLHKIVSKFFEYNYPIYSGSYVICLECKSEDWFSGPEFRSNIRDGFDRIFTHKSTCGTHDKLMKLINLEVDVENQSNIKRSKYVF